MELFIFLIRYSPSTRADIGKYACQHGLVAAASFFSKKMGKTVSNTIVHSMKRAYLEKREKRRAEDDGDLTVLPWKKRGPPVLLGEELDEKMSTYRRSEMEGVW